MTCRQHASQEIIVSVAHAISGAPILRLSFSREGLVPEVKRWLEHRMTVALFLKTSDGLAPLEDDFHEDVAVSLDLVAAFKPLITANERCEILDRFRELLHAYHRHVEAEGDDSLAASDAKAAVWSYWHSLFQPGRDGVLRSPALDDIEFSASLLGLSPRFFAVTEGTDATPGFYHWAVLQAVDHFPQLIYHDEIRDRVMVGLRRGTVQPGRESLVRPVTPLTDNLECMLRIVERDVGFLEYAGDALQQNPKLVLLAVKTDPWCIQFVHALMRDHEAVVLAAIRQKPRCLQFAGSRCRSRPEIALVAIEQDPSCWHFAGNPELVIRALERDSMCLVRAAKHVAEVPKVVLAALVLRPSCFEHLGKEWRGRREALLCAIEGDARYVQWAPPSLAGCQDFALQAIQRNPSSLESLSAACRDDPLLVMKAVAKDPQCIRFAGQGCLGNRRIALKAIRADPTCSQFFSDDLRSDPEVSCIIASAARLDSEKVH